MADVVAARAWATVTRMRMEFMSFTAGYRPAPGGGYWTFGQRFLKRKRARQHAAPVKAMPPRRGETTPARVATKPASVGLLAQERRDVEEIHARLLHRVDGHVAPPA